MVAALIRPVAQQEVLSPKVVVPEVFLVPRFGLDPLGQWVVSHSPFVCVPSTDGDDALLFMLTAVLNCSVSAWYIDSNARKFRSQYNKLSVALLRNVPIPDLTRIPLRIRRRANRTGSANCVPHPTKFDIESARALDQMVMRDVYGLGA